MFPCAIDEALVIRWPCMMLHLEMTTGGPNFFIAYEFNYRRILCSRIDCDVDFNGEICGHGSNERCDRIFPVYF